MPSRVEQCHDLKKGPREKPLPRVTQLKEAMTMSCIALGPFVMISRLGNSLNKQSTWTESTLSFHPSEGW